MIDELVRILMELALAIETASEDVVDPDWAGEQLEYLFSLLNKLDVSQRKTVCALVKSMASETQKLEGFSRRCQSLLSLADQLEDVEE